MTTRYYKATDDTFTIFRSTTSRTYKSAWITIDRIHERQGDAWVPVGEPIPVNFGFSAEQPNRANNDYPAVEIAKPEYEALVRVKTARIEVRRDELRAKGQERFGTTAPRDSWVRNLVGTTHDRIGFEEAAPRAVVAKDPTKTTYLSFVQGYDYLNAELWAGKLPTCLVTLQRKANCGGYFAPARFKTRDGKHHTDEIALNPSHFESTDTRYILSVLAHEMCHLEQYHFGKPAKGGYHNKEWGSMMKAIGLKPVSIDQPGKEVGNKVGHTIDAGGRFDLVCAALLKQGIQIDWVEAWSNEGLAKAKKKLASKTKYSCPQCGVNAWAKPDTHLICGDCSEDMEPEA